MVFGRDTVASFLRDSNEVTVLLSQGNVSLVHDVNGMPLRMKIGDVSVVPVSGFKTLGEVATLNGAVVVTAKEGMLRVEGNGQVVNVAKGKTITVVPGVNAPQGGGAGAGGAGRVGGGSTALEAGALGAGGLAAILAGVALSRAGTASTNASSADSAAASAASAAASAASAAAAAASAAAAGLSAAQASAIAAGCALDAAVNPKAIPGLSPYTPPSGVSCWNQSTW
jgi:hypothetical protein